MKYYRVYADQNGESHSEEVTVPMSATDFAPPAPPVDLSPVTQVANLVFLSVPAGWYGAPHPAPRRQFLILLAGELEGTTSDGEVMRHSPGTVFLLEDTWGKGHATRAVGDDPMLLAVVQLPG
jgi:quercetin dioxygenase-like cupin family protein